MEVDWLARIFLLVLCTKFRYLCTVIYLVQLLHRITLITRLIIGSQLRGKQKDTFTRSLISRWNK